MILMSLAAGHLALSKDEKAMGTVLVDIGAGATTIAVFDENHLVATSTLPIGGEYITNDIAYGLRTQADIAEKIKLKFGCAVVEHAASDQVFKVNRIGSNVDKEFSQVDLANIIEPRVQEIFSFDPHGSAASGIFRAAGRLCINRRNGIHAGHAGDRSGRTRFVGTHRRTGLYWSS